MATGKQKEKHIFRTELHGNSNVGLAGYASEKYALIGMEFTEEQAEEIKQVLKVPTYRISLCGTSLIGVFGVGNSKCLLVPGTVFDYELKVLDKIGIKYHVLETDLTALGNNILCNDEGCIVNAEFSEKEIREIGAALEVPVKKGTIAGLEITGALAICNDQGGVVSRDVEDKELKLIEKTLKLKFTQGTVNVGSPQVKSGFFCNNNGLVIGQGCTGPEINNIDEALGFLG